MSIQDKITNALTDLRELLIQGKEPENEIRVLAVEYGIPVDILEARAAKMIQDPSLQKYQDESFRKSQSRIDKKRAAVNAAKLAFINGSDREFDEIIHEKLGSEFAVEEKNEVALGYLLDAVSETKKNGSL